MSDVKKEIISIIKQSLAEFTSEKIDFLVERPENETFGDYSSNVALIAFGKNQESGIKNQAGKSPMELAQKIVDFIIHNSKFMIHFQKVEAVHPGFINFRLSKEYLVDKLNEILRLRSGQVSENLKGKKIMVEFTDPNPFKEFHIGHLYSNVVGESISRLLEAMSADVKRANYQGDVGMHVAKALYGLLQFTINDLQLTKLEKESLREKIKILGRCYAVGAKVYEEDPSTSSGQVSAKKEIEELNKKIYDKDPAIMALYEKGRQWSLEYFETIYKRLGTKFDFYYFESEVGVNGLKLVQEYLKKEVFEESQGAVIFPGEKQGLHNRVFINSLGLPTYEAKELGLAFKKYEDFKFDQSIVVTGNEIIGYFKVLLAALGKINSDLAVKIRHLPHGMVRLPTGKMSSRSGNVLTGEWLLDEAKKLLKSKYPEMEEAALEKVAVGSVKYALLKSSIGHDIEFNFEESINMLGNSGPYLQYTFARTQSVLAKVKNDSGQARMTSFWGAKRLQNLKPEEMSLLRSLSRFPEVIEEAAGKFAPNLLCNYLFDLAQKFNLFYQKHKIIAQSLGVNGEHPGGVIETQEFRIALTSAVGQIIKNGLNLLGIQAPEKM